MSNYKIGCLVPVRGAALEKQSYEVGVGALIATPGFIRDQIDQVHTEVMAHDRDIARQALPGHGQHTTAQPADPAMENWWRQVWRPFMAQWTAFRADHDSWYENLWGSTLETLDRYRQKLIDLRAAAKRAGFNFDRVPAPRPPEEGLVDTLRGVGGFVKNVTYVLLFLAGGWLVFKIVAAKGGPL